MTSENKKLQQQVQELQGQLKRYKKSNKLLKKRVSQLVTGNKQAITVREPGEGEGEQINSALEVATRVKSVFFENVSHEIRSSMNGIVGMTNLVLETQLGDEQREYLEMVESSVDRLLVVVNEVLDFSRIENGELALEPENFNLKQSLDHDLYVLSAAAKKRGLGLSCSVAPDVPAFIHGDAPRLVQVVTNLVNNGIRFTEEGEVSIKIENDGYNKSQDLQLGFSITDTGRGIAPEKLELISHYFKRTGKSNVTTPLSVGTTGLGLTVTSQLVKIMGGVIDVESGPEGTTFRVILPFKEVAVISDEEKASTTLENIQAEPSYVLRGAKILLAEDEYINRVLIETILQQLGAEVDSVESGKEAVELACGGDYQLVLMDVQMDDIDGLQATRRIRSFERREGGHVGIIALTALALPGDREKCLQAGMDDYIPKPVQPEELIEVVSQFLTSRALIFATNPETQANLVRTLVKSGWGVTIAESRRSALYEVSLSQFDLIVLDLSTPDLEGMSVVRVVRQLEEYSGQQARIIGIVDEETSLDQKDQYLDGCIVKPLTREDILKQLEVVEETS